MSGKIPQANSVCVAEGGSGRVGNRGRDGVFFQNYQTFRVSLIGFKLSCPQS